MALEVCPRSSHFWGVFNSENRKVFVYEDNFVCPNFETDLIRSWSILDGTFQFVVCPLWQSSFDFDQRLSFWICSEISDNNRFETPAKSINYRKWKSVLRSFTLITYVQRNNFHTYALYTWRNRLCSTEDGLGTEVYSDSVVMIKTCQKKSKTITDESKNCVV